MKTRMKHSDAYLHHAHNPVTWLYTQDEKRMPIARTKPRTERGETINLRASQRQKLLIDRAADALGRTRSDFMLDTACREAESVLLDRRYFSLSEDDFKKFVAMLDSPPEDSPRLRRLLQSKPPWDRSNWMPPGLVHPKSSRLSTIFPSSTPASPCSTIGCAAAP